MQVFLKKDVNPNISVELAVGLGWIRAKWEQYKLGNFVVTSCKDGTHVAGSAHKQDQPENVPGEAVDIRSWEHWNKEAHQHDAELTAFARMLQTAGFRVILHPEWMPEMPVPPHLHVAIGQPIFKVLP